jgi:ribose 5-phosphate isomerase B
MKVIIGADHRGFALKQELVGVLQEWGYEVLDVGGQEYNPEDDYVDYAIEAVRSMSGDDRAILLCGTGYGMEMVANRRRGIRAILGFGADIVKLGRIHEDANVLSIPAEWVRSEEVINIVRAFLETPFGSEERRVRRLEKMENWAAEGD